MNVIHMTDKKINELCSRGVYWKEISKREEPGINEIYAHELREVFNSIGFYNVLAIVNNYAENERRMKKDES